MLKVLYETDKEPVLNWLPSKLTRSTPPYAVLTIASYPQTPIGPFSLASQHIGCRAGFFIRAFTVQAVVNRPEAMAALREVWGYPCRLGEVELEAGSEEVTATVSCAGERVVEAALTDGSAIDPGSVRLDPVLNVRTAPSLENGKQHDLLQLVQIDPEAEAREAVRGRGSLQFPSTSETAPWHLLPVRNIVAAVYCTLDTELPLARFVMPY
jgi:acetoacetate decarboxylase